MNAVLQKLKQIKKYCGEHAEVCDNCVYHRPQKRFDIEQCVIANVVCELGGLNPDEWDLDVVEEILNDCD